MLATCPSQLSPKRAISIGDQRSCAHPLFCSRFAVRSVRANDDGERLGERPTGPLLQKSGCTDSTFLTLDLFRDDRDGVFARFDAAAGLVRVDLGELGAEEQDLGGIINPKQQSDQRARGAIRGSSGPAAEIKTH